MALEVTSTTYGGSLLLEPLARTIHLQIDETNHTVAQLFCILFGFVYRNHLSPSKVGPTIRHVVESTLGLCVLNFCFGRDVFHVLTQSLICYLLMKCLKPGLMEKVVFVVSFSYLSMAHIYRQFYHQMGHALDITAPLMFNVLRITSLALCLSDGAKTDDDKMSPKLKKYAVKKFPSLLEFLSYALSFHGCLCGPFVFYKDFLAFIEGNDPHLSPQKNNNNKLVQNGSSSHNNVDKPKHINPSPLKVIFSLLLHASVCGLAGIMVREYFSSTYLTDPEFSQRSFLFKVTYIPFFMLFVRLKYYLAWELAHAGSASCGLGFNGYDKSGNSKWDLTSNVNIIKLESATNMKVVVDNWNITTTHWVRHSFHDRGWSLPLTFIVIAMWHGFYPGYYVTALTGALLLIAAKVVRKNVRPFFQGDATWRFIYDVITWCVTQVALGYFAMGFVLLRFGDTLLFYRNLYFFLHVLCVMVIVASKVLKS